MVGLRPTALEEGTVPASFPVRLVGKTASGSALARSCSPTGMLVTARRAFVVGAPLELALHVDPERLPPHKLTGRVVETGPNDEDPSGLWPYKVSIHFDVPQPSLPGLIRG